MIRTLRWLAVFVLLASSAAAHSLRVFATVSGGEVSGYGFFVGGGRPQGVVWIARMGAVEIANGITDENGGFRFQTPKRVGDEITVTINTGEGHVASKSLPLRRFASSLEVATGEIAIQSDTPRTTNDKSVQEPALSEAVIEAAVERRLAPLLERVEVMDARMRLTDVIASVCLILGIGGMVLWARSRRS